MSGSRTVLIVGIVIALVAGAVAAAVFLPGLLSGGTEEFSAADVPFTFEYPSRLRRVTKENRAEFGFDQDDGVPEKYNVVALAEKGSNDSIFLLGVSRMPGEKELDQESWDRLKQVGIDSTNSKVAKLREQGLTVEGPRFQDEQVGGMRASTIFTSYYNSNAAAEDGQVLIDAGAQRYLMDFLHMTTGGRADSATFDEIVDSLEVGK
ncbi:MAG: hypothetical protein V1748_07030 [Actinomycetota bacterium]